MKRQAGTTTRLFKIKRDRKLTSRRDPTVCSESKTTNNTCTQEMNWKDLQITLNIKTATSGI